MLFLSFYSSWCHPCEWMEENAFSTGTNAQLLSDHYVPVRIDVDEIEGFELKNHYSITALPTVLVFSKDGRMSGRIEQTMDANMLRNFLLEQLKSGLNRSVVTNISPTSLPFEFNSSEPKEPVLPQRASFKLQLGLFSSYENTLLFYEKVSQKISEPIIILHDFKGNSVVYRVLLGNFGSVAEANQFKKTLNRDLGIKSHLYL